MSEEVCDDIMRVVSSTCECCGIASECVEDLCPLYEIEKICLENVIKVSEE